MGRLFVIAAAASAGLAAILLVPGLRESLPAQGQQPPRQPSGTVVAVRTVQPDQPVPTLTPAEQDRARAFVTGNDRLRQWVGGRQFTVDAVYVWNSSPTGSPNGRSEKLGAAVHITFAQPFAGTFAWPVKLYDGYTANGEGIGPYREGVQTVTVRNVTELDVVVDFAKNQIVEIRPGPGTVFQR